MKTHSLSHLTGRLATMLDWEAKGLPQPPHEAPDDALRVASEAMEEVAQEMFAFDETMTLLTGLPSPDGFRQEMFLLGLTDIMGGFPMAYSTEEGGSVFRTFAPREEDQASYRDRSETPFMTYGAKHGPEVAPGMVVMAARGSSPALMVAAELHAALEELEDWVIDVLREPDYLLHGFEEPIAVLTTSEADGLDDLTLDLKRMTPQTKTAEIALNLLHKALWTVRHKITLGEGDALLFDAHRVAIIRPIYPNPAENVWVTALASTFDFPHKWATDKRAWIVRGT